jgi:CheY-like chemotaxis protein
MRIVLASPYAAERSALEQLLTDDAYDVAAFASREEALDAAAASATDVFIADAQVAGLDGIALSRALADRRLAPRVILLCPRVSRTFEKNDVVCLTKPIDISELHRWLGPAHQKALVG